MENLATNRADVIKQALANTLTNQLPWSIQLSQRSVLARISSPNKFLKGFSFTRKSVRKLRIEGVERDAAVILELLRYTDLTTMQVGVPNANGSFLKLPYRFFAKKAGWRTDEDEEIDKALVREGKRPKERGIKRVWRAFECLRRADYVDVIHSSKMLDDGSYEGMAAIKRVSPKLFYDLGISVKQLEKCRQQAKKRLLKLKEKYKQELFKAAQDYIKPVKKKIDRILNKDAGLDKRKAKSQEAYRLRQMPENAQLSSSEFYLKYPSLKPDG